MGKLIDSVHFVVAAQAYDATAVWNNASYWLGNAINVENYRHLTVVIITGVVTGAVGAITLRQASTAAGCVVGATIVPITHVYKNLQTSSESDTWALVTTELASNVLTPTTTINMENYIIELETAVLTYPWVAINLVSAATPAFMTALYILSQPRYISAEDAPTAIV